MPHLEGAVLLYTVLAALVGYLAVQNVEEVEERERRRRPRRFGVHPLNRRRYERGFFYTTYPELRQDGSRFFKYTRMTIQQFDNLVHLVGPRLQKHSRRPSLPPALRLLLSIQFLATGNSMTTLALSYRIGISSVHAVLQDTCPKIWDVLAPLYLPDPTEEDFRRIAMDYERRWDLANCCGSIDGKHIRVICFAHTGSMFFNYKHYFSVVLMACCDAHLLFTYVDIGAQGSISDGGVFRHSAFGHNIINGTCPLPANTPLPREPTTTPFPYFFVGDEAFPLRRNLMTPYSKNMLGPVEIDTFNTRISRARFTIENTFGLLSARWRIFHREIECRDPETAVGYVKAAVVLHNYIMKTNPSRLYNPCHFDEQGRLVGHAVREAEGHRFRDLPDQHEARNATRVVYGLRDFLRDYLFSPAGSIPYQVRQARRM